MLLRNIKKLSKNLKRLFLLAYSYNFRKNLKSYNFVEAVSFPAFWMDKHKIYQGCNQIFVNLVGISDPKDIVGLTDQDLPFSIETIKKRNEIFDAILNGTSVNSVLYDSITTPTGQMIWAQKRFSPLKNFNGKVLGIAGIIMDISERVMRRKETDSILRRKKTPG